MILRNEKKKEAFNVAVIEELKIHIRNQINGVKSLRRHLKQTFQRGRRRNRFPSPPEAPAETPSVAASKSSSSGLRLAVYPEHILWERELWSRLRDHIKQWLFVVNKARAACRGPSLSPLTLPAGSSLSTAAVLDRRMCPVNVKKKAQAGLGRIVKS